MELSEAQRKHLRRLGHKLKPVVLIGEAGLSAAVCEEIESALDHHELLKVSVRAGDRESRDRIIGQLCAQSSAELVQRVGNMALLFRANPRKKNRMRLPTA